MTLFSGLGTDVHFSGDETGLRWEDYLFELQDAFPFSLLAPPPLPSLVKKKEKQHKNTIEKQCLPPPPCGGAAVLLQN